MVAPISIQIDSYALLERGITRVRRCIVPDGLTILSPETRRSARILVAIWIDGRDNDEFIRLEKLNDPAVESVG